MSAMKLSMNEIKEKLQEVYPKYAYIDVINSCQVSAAELMAACRTGYVRKPVYDTKNAKTGYIVGFDCDEMTVSYIESGLYDAIINNYDIDEDPFIRSEKLQKLFKERAFDSCCEKTSIHEVFDELRLRTAIENADQELYNKALKIVTSSKDDTTSISYLQRKMNVQYDEAERLMDLLEENGVVSPKNNIHKRTIIR